MSCSTLKCLLVLIFINLSKSLQSENTILIMRYLSNRKDQELFVNFTESYLKNFLICLCDTTVSSCQISAFSSEDSTNLTTHYSTSALNETVKSYRQNVSCRPLLTKLPYNKLQFNLTCWTSTEDCHPDGHDQIGLKATWQVRSKLGNHCLGYGLRITWTDALKVSYYNSSLFNITKHKRKKKTQKSHVNTSCISNRSSDEPVTLESSYEMKIAQTLTTVKLKLHTHVVKNYSVNTGLSKNVKDLLNKSTTFREQTIYSSTLPPKTQTVLSITDSHHNQHAKMDNNTIEINRLGRLTDVNKSLSNSFTHSKAELEERKSTSNYTVLIHDLSPLFPSTDRVNIDETFRKSSSSINHSNIPMDDIEHEIKVGASTAEQPADVSAILIAVFTVVIVGLVVAVVVIGVRRKKRALRRSRRYSLPRLQSVEEKNSPPEI